MVFALASCGGSKNDSKKSKELDFSKIDEIEVKWHGYPISLSVEQTEYVISLLQDGEWSSEAWKINPEYHLKAGEFVFYCDLNNGKIVNTPTTDRTLFLTDEQIDTLKSYFQTVSADAIAQITVGMTLHQVQGILKGPGNGVEYDEATREGTLQYECEDGSKYNIVFVYGDGIKSTFVTSITKIDTESSPEA
jgi:hypothetical protein